MPWFRVILPVEIEGRSYNHGERVQLSMDAAAANAAALISDEEESNGRCSEEHQSE